MTILDKFTRLINTGFIIAFVVHVGFICYYILYPGIPETVVYKNDLKEIEFPISFRMCIQQTSNNDQRFRDLGYENERGFFEGRSIFNRSMVGWNGHVENSTKMIGKVQGMLFIQTRRENNVFTLLDILKRASLNWSSIIDKISITTLDDQFFSVRGTEVDWTLAFQYPSCQALDLTKYFNLTNTTVEQITIEIARYKDHQFLLFVEERNRALSRPLKSNMLAYRGPPMYLNQLGHSRIVKVILGIEQLTSSEKDKKKRCKIYPNSQYSSFRECDEENIKKIFQEEYKILPFWIAKNLQNVSENRYSYPKAKYWYSVL